MRRLFIISASFLLLFSSCNNDAKIINLLQSKNKDDVILGAHLAGDKKDKKYHYYSSFGLCGTPATKSAKK